MPIKIRRTNMNRKIQTLQILRELARRHRNVKNAILHELGLSDSDFDSVDEALYEVVVDHLEECGCCSCHHRPEYWGDCRNDAERF
jgi:hypothetical protein